MNNADPGRYGSSWLFATKVASPRRSALNVDLDVEVCVVGAGLAGLTVAREVARRGWSVVVLEAASVAWNASGRSTGFVLPGYAATPSALVSRVGIDDARRLWQLSAQGAEYVRKTAQDDQMPGVHLSGGGWLHVSKIDDDRAMQAEAELLAGKFGAGVEFRTAEQVREELQSPLYFSGLYYPGGFGVHSLNYALGLAAAAERDGARIYENTPALDIDPAGVLKRVVTKDARVRAHHVVLAGNVHLAKIAPQFGKTLVPVHTYAIVTAPLGEALHEAVRFPGVVSDTDLADNNFRVVEGDRLMWSGRNTVWGRRPQDYAGTLLAQIERTLPQLRNARAEYAWTGVLGNTVHRMPQVGEITPGLWLLSGFGGRGLSATAAGGELVARAILDGDRTWEMFTPFALVWSGGLYGRLAQQFSYWSSRVKTLFHGRRARRQQERRQREAASQSVAAPPPEGAGVPAPVTPVESAPIDPPEPTAMTLPAPAPASAAEPATMPRPDPGSVDLPETAEAAALPGPLPDSDSIPDQAQDVSPLTAANDAEAAPADTAAAASSTKPKRTRKGKKRPADASIEGQPAASEVSAISRRARRSRPSS